MQKKRSKEIKSAPRSTLQVARFKREIWRYYKMYGREMPWRHVDDPYKVIVSEVMLQQTQVDRVRPKYEQFLRVFPNLRALAEAPLADVLLVWQGLGYNRRAKYLKSMAQMIVINHGGVFPRDISALRRLPGIGPGTAGSLTAFAFNKPSVFIETNIRRVFIHFFFKNARSVSDSEILPLVEASLDRKKPRLWYYALMDYGTLLAKTHVNANRKSKHYTKQSKFEGSDRQIRGKVLRRLLEGPTGRAALAEDLSVPENRLAEIVDRLITEKFILEKRTILSLHHA